MLSTPIAASVLTALGDGARSQIELRRIAGSPAQSTLRTQLKRLEEMGVLEKQRRDRFPGGLLHELTPVGRELVFVIQVLDRWLEQAPGQSLELGTSAAKAATKALAEGWSAAMLRALASGPVSLTELDRLIASLSYPTLERRLTALRLAGLVEVSSANGRGTPYAVTEWLRMGIAPLAAAGRWERRHLSSQTPPMTRLDVETAFLLTIPRVRRIERLQGRCRLAVDISGDGKRRLAGVLIRVDRAGEIVACTTNLQEQADAWALGSASAWLNAVIERDVDGLELGGRGRLARAVVDGFHEALF